MKSKFLFVWGEGKKAIESARGCWPKKSPEEKSRLPENGMRCEEQTDRLEVGREGGGQSSMRSIEGEERKSPVRWFDLQLAAKLCPLASSWRPPILFLGQRH
jgi:hypothetical protein